MHYFNCVGETEQKQMGELGQGEEDQLDRKMWAPEDEEDKVMEMDILTLYQPMMHIHIIS